MSGDQLLKQEGFDHVFEFWLLFEMDSIF